MKKNHWISPFIIATALWAGNALAHPEAAHVVVEGAWARATVPGQQGSGAFMRLTAKEPLTLVAVRTPAAAVAEVHEMKMDGDVMRMRALTALPLPVGQTVELKPGGYHVMLLDLKQQVKEGDTVPLTLVFEAKDGKRETVEVKAQVRALNASAQPAAGHGEHRH